MKSILSCADYVNQLDIARQVVPQYAIHKIKRDHRSQQRLCSPIPFSVIYDPLIALAELLIASTTPVLGFDRSGLSGILDTFDSSVHHLRYL